MSNHKTSVSVKEESRDSAPAVVQLIKYAKGPLASNITKIAENWFNILTEKHGPSASFIK